MKFDCIVSNAPYNNGLHEKFEAKYFDICDGQIVWVSPLSFLLGKKQNKRITLELDKYKTDIEQINGNEYFDAAIGGTMGIVFCDMAGSSSITFDVKKYSKCDEISYQSESSDPILIKFGKKVNCKFLTDNLYEHLHTNEYAIHTYDKLVTNPDENAWVVGIIRLHAPLKKDGSHGDSWTAMISKNKLDDYIGQYKDVIKRIRKTKTGGIVPILQYYFSFKSKKEAYNFRYYIQTTFVQACLTLIKQNANFIDSKEIAYVPWQDFTQEWNDEKLFKKYGITKEEIQNIYDILPNYYNIERIDLDTYKLNSITFDGKQYNKCDEISLTSNDELLNEFTDKIINLAKKDNLNNHLTYSTGLLSHSPGIKQHTEYKPNDMWYCIRMVKQSHDLCILPTSSETPIKYKEIGYKTVQGKKKNGDIINKPFMEYYYHFDDIHTAKNCINYFKTMFVRILLYQYMTQTQNFLDTTTQFIPWFNFSDPMFAGQPEDIDIALFKKYNISQNIVNHIIQILPNYYKLDLSKYIL